MPQPASRNAVASPPSRLSPDQARAIRNLVDDDFDWALREPLELVRNGGSVGFTGEERRKIGPGSNTQEHPHLVLV
jgi:hypothetical protein